MTTNARSWRADLALIALTCCALACKSSEATAPRFQVEVWPAPPRLGAAQIAISISEPSGKPVSGARVQVEANMSHPGMKPEFATATESEAGSYVTDLSFTMRGDWYLLVDARWDGETFTHRHDIPRVGAGSP